ncbi:TonB-dependent receptor, partial [candidate division KSB1 bacterium]|nr:TonB-dependent receptor [candidate division KSB1 bacterium]
NLTAGETRELDIALDATGISVNAISISASRRPEKTLEAPASISILEERDILQNVMTSSAEVLRNVTGVDMATTGIDRREIVLRGFNNAFSGATYILTDYRQAALPSLAVNIHSIMPNMVIDLDKVEIVRGPGSALYGAGVDAGVIHYITKDPFSYPGTSISVNGGERSFFSGAFRHAGVLGEKVGYKLTGQYGQADDWELDPNDPLDKVQLTNEITGEPITYNRAYQKVNVNGLLQFRLQDEMTLTFNGGFSALDATVLSGIGTVQADGFGYSYGQMRLQAGRFFAQGYINKNNAGDSFVYGTGLQVVDNSVVTNLQAQYDFDLTGGNTQFIVGADYDRTSPDTKNTIYGRNDDNDLISEFGVYGQSLFRVSPKLDFTGALRADYNNIEDGFQLSPRAAFVFKPSLEHSLRLTYNRAYSLPGSNSLFLDIVGRRTKLTDEFAIIERGRGTRTGFTFNSARSANGITASGLLPVPGVFGENIFQYSAAGIPTQNVPLAAVYGILYAGLRKTPIEEVQAELANNGLSLPTAIIESFLNLLSPVELQPGLPTTNVTGLGTSMLLDEPIDVEPLKSTITQTFEAGYKGLIEDRLLFGFDAYYTKKNNFISGVTQITPISVFTNISAELTPALATAIAANPLLSGALTQAGLDAQTVAALIVGFAAEDLARLPVGVVQPDGAGNQVPGEITGGYRNFGNVNFWGFDATIQYLATDKLTLFGNMSYVNDDFFDNNELEESDPGLYLSLNASKFKAKGGFAYNVPKGISFNASGRFTKAFPVASGPYIGGLPIPEEGDIGGLKDYFIIDVGIGYDLGQYFTGARIDFTVQNLFNDKHHEFIGAPKIGRLALGRLSINF